MAGEIIEVRQIVKQYRGVRAVDGVSFAVEDGACLGMLGPNGAGKTTTIEIMEGITAPTNGDVLYKGAPLGASFREQAGIQFQSTALQDHLTVRAHLNLFRRLYKRAVPPDELIRQCALESLLDRDARKLSGGQRQRLLLAIALTNDPQVVFLDEPTTGLDPQARRNFWELIRRIKARRKTIVLTTHYMEEAYQLCDRILIMDHGRIIADGTPDALLAGHFDEIILELPAEDLTVDADTLPFKVMRADRRVEIATRAVNEVMAHLLENGVSLQRMNIRAPTLEDLFLELTGKELRA